MRHRQQAVMITIAMGLLLTMAALATLNMAPPEARADTVPTPAAIMNQSDSAALVTFVDADTTTTDAGGNGVQLYTFEYCNLQYVIDQAPEADTVPNTTTLTIQWSMDNVNWSDGPALVAANTADADSIVQVPVLGRYQRVYEDHTGTTGITVTVKGVCK